jgi:hypothetical protein
MIERSSYRWMYWTRAMHQERAVSGKEGLDMGCDEPCHAPMGR